MLGNPPSFQTAPTSHVPGWARTEPSCRAHPGSMMPVRSTKTGHGKWRCARNAASAACPLVAIVVDGTRVHRVGFRLSTHHLLVVTRQAGKVGPHPTRLESPGKARGPRPLGIDCRLLAVVADFDAPRLGLFGHRNGQPQHSVVVAGLDFVGVEVFPE